MRPHEDNLRDYLVFQFQDDTEDGATFRGRVAAFDAQEACKAVAFGFPSQANQFRIQRVPFGRYVALPVDGSAEVAFTLKEERLDRSEETA